MDDSSSDFLGDSPLSEGINFSDDELDDTAIDESQNPEMKTELEQLGVGLVDQTTLEERILAEAHQDMMDQDKAKEQKRLDKCRKQARDAQDSLSQLKEKLKDRNATTIQRDRLQNKINEQVMILRNAKNDEADIIGRMEELEQTKSIDKNFDPSKRQADETQKEYLIRTGKITPFATISETTMTENGHTNDYSSNIIIPGTGGNLMTHQNLRKPRAMDTFGLDKEFKTTWQRLKKARQKIDDYGDDSDDGFSDYKDSEGEGDHGATDEDEEYVDLVEPTLSSDEETEMSSHTRMEIERVYEDDGIDVNYMKRLQDWIYDRKLLRYTETADENASLDELDERMTAQILDPDSELFEPHPDHPDAQFGTLRIPGEIWTNLFDYQKTCVQWLWELHNQKVGGIIGDEMGLGKTVQIIAFLSGLYYSKILGPGVPSIVVCPATVLKQWVEEFHRWWPPLRVAILHSSGSGIRSGTTTKANTDKVDNFGVDESDDEFDPDRDGRTPRKKRFKGKQGLLFTKTGKNAAKVVDTFIKEGGILITTYSGIQTYREILLKHRWGYVILDEGHKIRNPDSETTLACKQFKTSHRIILSGTPMQNNLKELWSLFDFIFPGRLGTLPVFETQFSVPISLGGYANASNVEVQTSYKCTCMLRDLINPYLLRRMKVDVATDLPKKSEQVLFCKLTPSQRESYQQFIHSKDMDSVLERRRQVLFGIDIVRKICNHPDIVHMTSLKMDPSYGDPEKSGKMVVVRALLHMWRHKHRVLLFSQTRQMLDILEMMIKQLGYRYRRMDGTTPVHHRMTMVHEYNVSPDIYIFLLTTKVGGLGLNLTGADRVILFDPDWNPSTDMQARERAWRLGQTKDVTIYRLMTSGTIEEKIYHRQIYKQFLTNKILKNPKQQRFFDSSNLKSLFTLGADDDTSTETGRLFQGTEIKYKKNRKRKHDNDQDQIQALQSVSNVESLNKKGAPSNQVKSKSKSNNESEGDDNVLSSLFEMTGIHSALQHDRIMESDAQDTYFVEQEATMIAERAASALKESRKRTRLNRIGTPTWTGRSGYVGPARSRPTTPRFGQKTNFMKKSDSPSISPSSSSTGFGKGNISGFKGSSIVGSNTLLAQMKQRQQEVASLSPNGSPSSTAATSPSSFSAGQYGKGDLPQEKEKLMAKIRDFMADHGGKSSTHDIIDKLQMDIGKNDIVVFRAMIQTIATFEKGQDGLGVWSLKKDFR